MIAVHLEGGEVCVRDVPEPPLPEGYARIRLLLAGICNTDLELLSGYYGFSGIPGHEFVGQVTEGPHEWLGVRVVGDINLSCGVCAFCRDGMNRHCPHRTVLGIVRHAGAFAQSLTLPVANLHAVPDRISTAQAVFTEPLAAACQILDQVSIPQGQSVAVLGDGKLGLLIAQVLCAHGARVTHFGRHPAKLAISAAMGMTTKLATEEIPRAEFAVVVEATGSAAGLSDAIAMTRPRGTVVMKSTVHARVPVDTAPAIVNEITLVGSRCGRFEPALSLLSTGRVTVEPLIDSRFPLLKAPEAFQRAQSNGVLKVLLH